MLPPEEKAARQKIYDARYREKNIERLRERDRAKYWKDIEASRAYGREKRARHPETSDAASTRFKRDNPELKRAYDRAWCQLNKEKYAARKQQRRALMLHCTEFDKFVIMQAAILCEMRENTTRIKWQIDHIVPLSKGGTHDFGNIQVVPAVWNAAKRDKNTDRFFATVSGAPMQDVAKPSCVN